MKNKYCFAILFLFLTLIVNTNFVIAQNPTYNLRAMNFQNAAPNILEFDIYVEHTNFPVTFEYSMGQYFLSINPLIANGGILTYTIIGSDLPANMQPRNPSVGTATSPPATVLRLAVNPPPGAGAGFIMTNNGNPGTKIVKMRLQTSAVSFANVPDEIQWRNEPIISFATKIYAYVGTLNGPITTPETHTVIRDSVSNLYRPLNGSSIYLKNIEFSWYRFTGAISYKLDISTDVNFNTIIFSDSTITDTLIFVNDFMQETSYYWRVSARNDSIYFTSSPIWLFNTISLQASLLIPENNDPSVPVPVEFTWTLPTQLISIKQQSITYENFDNIGSERVTYDTISHSISSGADESFKLDVAIDPSFNNVVFKDSLIADTFRVVSELDLGTAYYWRVTADSDSIFYSASEVRNFTTAGPPQIILISPQNNATSVELPVNFQWMRELEAVTYKLEVARDALFNTIVFSDSTITEFSKIVDGLDYYTQYFWKVSGKNDTGYFISSVINNFTTDSNRVSLVNPENNSTNILLPVHFIWNKKLPAVWYRLRVATDSGFSSVVFNDSAITDTFKTVNGLAENTNYYWKVSAKDSASYFATSLIWKFKTSMTPSSIPAYELKVDSMRLVSINAPDDALEFGVYLTHTNAPTHFGLAGQQLFFSFNPAILHGCSLSDTVNCVSYKIIGSQLPESYIPRGPTIGTATSPTATVLRLAINSFQGTPGLDITGATNLLIVRMRLHNKAPGDATFNLAWISLAWRNPPVVAFVTKLFAYINDVNTDITTPATHSIDSSGLGFQFLPIELASFSSAVNRNNVSLYWSTVSETNNSGFEIERRDARRSPREAGETQDEWKIVGHVNGNGTTNETRNYSFAERLNSGKYRYRLKQIDHNGNLEYFNLNNEVDVGVPSQYNLSQNYPNPFNPTTKIDFELPHDGKVKVVLYDVSGREAATLLDENKTAGYYTVQFDAGNLSTGMYFYRISVNEFVETKKMLLIK